MSDNLKISSKHERAVAALISEKNIQDAAKHAGINVRTLRRWSVLDEFQKVYREARRQLVQQASARVQGAMGEAVETLKAVMKDKGAPASARVSAARAIIDTGLKASEIEDLTVRVEALEAAMLKGKGE